MDKKKNLCLIYILRLLATQGLVEAIFRVTGTICKIPEKYQLGTFFHQKNTRKIQEKYKKNTRKNTISIKKIQEKYKKKYNIPHKNKSKNHENPSQKRLFVNEIKNGVGIFFPKKIQEKYNLFQKKYNLFQRKYKKQKMEMVFFSLKMVFFFF